MSRWLSPPAVLACAVVALLPALAVAGDWPDWRGPTETAFPPKKICPRSGRSTARAWPGRLPMAAARRPSSWATISTCRTPPASGETEQEQLLCFNADTGKMLWEYPIQHVPERRAGAPRRLGFPGGRSRNGQCLRLRRQQSAHGAERRRQEDLGALDHRGVFAVHHARRPHRLAHRRRQPGHRQPRRPRPGARRPIARSASSRSTKGPATSCGSARRAAAPTTPATRR